ncbi:succinate dehydrogenase assembly factor 2 [Methylophilales bacterium]|nr:succinate dehydrogenase assembly factor 2 [Methylophilaceae bacterium]QZP17921.1 succinate dehydrogenase assembly factor 2 [Methylophilales bacterium]|tara:strand:+ start:83 stop:325 length:243 start_codon:yes stop_codon:yes gene_type:complete
MSQKMILDNQIKYRCRRGLLELDLILNNFYENRLQQLSIEMKKLLLEFLEMDDNNIWNILNSSKYSKKYDSLVKLIYPIN